MIGSSDTSQGMIIILEDLYDLNYLTAQVFQILLKELKPWNIIILLSYFIISYIYLMWMWLIQLPFNVFNKHQILHIQSQSCSTLTDKILISLLDFLGRSNFKLIKKERTFADPYETYGEKKSSDRSKPWGLLQILSHRHDLWYPV